MFGRRPRETLWLTLCASEAPPDLPAGEEEEVRFRLSRNCYQTSKLNSWTAKSTCNSWRKLHLYITIHSNPTKTKKVQILRSPKVQLQKVLIQILRNRKKSNPEKQKVQILRNPKNPINPENPSPNPKKSKNPKHPFNRPNPGPGIQSILLIPLIEVGDKNPKPMNL
jgi:hypothetical protein